MENDDSKVEAGKEIASLSKEVEEATQNLQAKEAELEAKDKEIADMNAKFAKQEAEGEVDKLIASGKIIPANKEASVSMFLADKASFAKFVENTPDAPVEEERKELEKSDIRIITASELKELDEEGYKNFKEQFSKGEAGINPRDLKVQDKVTFAFPTLDQTLLKSNTGSFIISDLWQKELIYENRPTYVFDQFATKAFESTAATLRWAVVGTLSTSTTRGTLDEGTAIDKGSLTISQITKVPEEFGNALSWSRLNDALSVNVTDLKNNVAFVELRNNMQKVMDDEAYRELNVGTLNWVNGGTFGTGEVAVAFAGTVGNDDFLLNGTRLRDAVLKLQENKAPTFADGLYVGIFNPAQIWNLWEETQITDTLQYAAPQDLLSGEVMKWRGVKVMQTTQITSTSDDWGTSGTLSLYDGVVFGKDALGKGFVTEGEVSFYNDDQNDSQRTKKVTWYSLGGYKLLKPENVCRVRTTGNIV